MQCFLSRSIMDGMVSLERIILLFRANILYHDDVDYNDKPDAQHGNFLCRMAIWRGGEHGWPHKDNQ